jgi:hypothetical protein
VKAPLAEVSDAANVPLPLCLCVGCCFIRHHILHETVLTEIEVANATTVEDCTLRHCIAAPTAAVSSSLAADFFQTVASRTGALNRVVSKQSSDAPGGIRCQCHLLPMPFVNLVLNHILDPVLDFPLTDALVVLSLDHHHHHPPVFQSH